MVPFLLFSTPLNPLLLFPSQLNGYQTVERKNLSSTSAESHQYLPDRQGSDDRPWSPSPVPRGWRLSSSRPDPKTSCVLGDTVCVYLFQTISFRRNKVTSGIKRSYLPLP